MRVDNLSSTNFRNLSRQTTEFSPGVNLIIGENGQGKTNVLEAIYLFKFGRSFRTRRDGEMVRFGEPYCRAEVACTLRSGDHETFAVSIEADGTKRIKINSGEIERLSELLGRYRASRKTHSIASRHRSRW